MILQFVRFACGDALTRKRDLQRKRTIHGARNNLANSRRAFSRLLVFDTGTHGAAYGRQFLLHPRRQLGIFQPIVGAQQLAAGERRISATGWLWSTSTPPGVTPQEAQKMGADSCPKSCRHS